MSIITMKFWYKKSIVADYTAYKLRWYNTSLDMYPRSVRPYIVCPYAVYISLDEGDVANFNDVVALAMNSAEVGEILIGNEWLKLGGRTGCYGCAHITTCGSK